MLPGIEEAPIGAGAVIVAAGATYRGVRIQIQDLREQTDSANWVVCPRRRGRGGRRALRGAGSVGERVLAGERTLCSAGASARVSALGELPRGRGGRR
jgi:hypothetical protein